MIGKLLIGAIRIYKLAISPLLPPACRFYPSCSAYAAQAIEDHGALRGSWLGLRRLLKCHPLHPGGFDPVPGRTPIRHGAH
jgi:putative membrane protein insertion efficiency factor